MASRNKGFMPLKEALDGRGPLPPMSDPNPSRLHPVEYKILVKLDDVEEKTSGGLYIPMTLRDKQQMMQVEAKLIACGGNAFEDWIGTQPRIGDRVYVAKAAGYQVVGVDGVKYQLMNDKDIAAVIRE